MAGQLAHHRTAVGVGGPARRPGQDSFSAHGASFDLSEYGSVLVAGENRCDHNRIRTHDNHGRPFGRLAQ